MIYDSVARSFDVELKSSEIARKDSRISYSRESLLSLSEADICKELPVGADKSIFRDFRISYAREDLLSLAEVSVCKELPYGFDQSIISDLQDASKSVPDIHEQQGQESVSAGGFQEASTREDPARWNDFKLGTANSTHKRAPAIRKLQGHESLSFGRTSEASIEESTEKWDSYKLICADSKSKDSENFNGQQSRRPWVNSTTTGILRNVSQNPEKSGILGSWSGTKPSPGGSEIASSKLPGSTSLLSRCSQPYRPPSYFKALSQPETPKRDLNINKTFGHAEGPSKQRTTEKSWRKDSIDLKTNEPLQAVEEKQKSSGRDEEVIAKSGACTTLQEHSALQVVNHFRVAPPIFPSVSASVEPPCSTCGTAESCLREDSLNDKPPLQGQDEVTYHVEMLQPQILEGGRFSALIVLEDAEDVDPNLIDEANPASNAKPRDDQKIIVSNEGFAKTLNKGLRTQVASPLTKSTEKITRNIFPNNTVGKTAIMSSAMKASMNTAVSVKPLSKLYNSQGGVIAQQHKGIDIASKDLQKGFAKKTLDANHLATEANASNGSISENWQSSHCTKHQDTIMDSTDSCKLDSKSVNWFSDNDKAPGNFSLWPDLSYNNIWRTSTGMLTKENLLDKGQSRETSFYDQELGQAFEELTSSPIAEGVNFNPSFLFDDEADTNFEINLPDEDSLITVDDTYIFQEEMLNQSPENPLKGRRTASPFSGSNKPMKKDSLHQNLFLPDPWFHDSQLNIAKLFVNPSNTQADLRAPPQLQDPWRFHHYNYGLFPTDVVSIGQLPLMPQVNEPTVPRAHNFYPHLNNTLPSEPPLYHQVHQMPWCQKKPDLRGSLPQNYPGNVNSTYVGMRGRHGEEKIRPTFSQIIQIGRHGEEEIRPTFSQIIQMQIGMAKMKLETLPRFQQRANRKPISNPNR